MDVLQLTGTAVKSYEIGDLLGQGGYGVVYRAHQSAVLREVAIKVILPKYANSPEFIRRFESEAQVVARLEHPHIVPLYDYWREPDSAFLVMRYLRGGSLRDRIDRHGILDTEAAGKVLEQVGAALTFAHRNGVVHRDIKADNILLDEDGNAYLGDFGIAKEVGNEGSIAQGDIVGTPAYLAPEQIRGGEVGPQSDVYAFGIMLYEMLTGRRPFAELTLATLVYKHLNEPLPMIDPEELSLPSAFNSIIQRATAKDPSERYPDALSLVQDFRDILQQESSTVELSLTELDLTAFDLLETKNPYKGLRAFQQADAADFFGRSAMIERVLERLEEPVVENNFLAVIGPSGSGKSSLVKAGVLPALRQGRIEGSEDWFYAEMVPGYDPLEELSAALLSVSTSPLPGMIDLLRQDAFGLAAGVRQALPAEDSKLVLMIDQFEEVFTQIEVESERQQFLDLVQAAVSMEDSPIVIIVTLRADFYDRPLLYQNFGELIRKRTELVLPLSDDELAESVTGPAYRVGAVLEEGLIENILQDVREQPGALPLLQYALTELFERRDGALLTNAAYQDIGGTLGALARRAEEVYQEFDEAGRDMTRQMFLRLVTLGEGQEDTRRRILQSELTTLGAAGVAEDVVDRFGRYRLLTFDRDEATRGATVEVAHEALIRQWDRLREWLDESREDVRLERQLLHAAEEWEAAGKDSSYLMQGTRLQQFQEWSESTSLQLNMTELDFLKESLKAREERRAIERARQEREAALERQKARNLRIAAGIFAVAAVVAVVLSLFAFDQSNRAEAQRIIAEEQRGIAEDALVVAEEQRGIAEEARVVAEEQRGIAEEARVVAEEQRGIAEDALEIAEINERKNLSLALAANARNALSENEPALALPVAIEAKNAFQPPEAEVLRILGLASFSPGPRFRYADSTRSILAVASSPTGTTGAYAGTDGMIYMVNNETGETIRAIDAGSPIMDLSFSPDGTLLAAGLMDDSVGVWAAATGEEWHRLRGHELVVTDVEFSPDGQMLASSSGDKTVRLWDVASGSLLRVLEGHIGYIMKIDFSPDGTRLASSAADEQPRDTNDDVQDRKVRIWDVESGETVMTIDPQSGYIRDVEFSPDGRSVALGTWDGANGGTARIYDTVIGTELRILYAHRDTISDIEFSPDGHVLATASRDSSIKFWDLDKAVEIRSYRNFGDRVRDIEYTADGEYMLIGLAGNMNSDFLPDGSDNPAESAAYLWDLQNRTQVKAFLGHEIWTWTADISPDGALAASGSGPLSSPAGTDTSVRIWDIASGAETHKLIGHTDTVDSVHFALDGSYLLSAAWDATIRRWDVNTGEQLQVYEGHEGRVYMIDLMPNGEQFVSASGDGALKLWDIASGEVIRTYSGHQGEVAGVHISPDGSLMVSAGSWGGSNTIRLWDIASGEEIRQFTGHSGAVNYARFAPNMEFIISTSWDDTVRMWDLETGEEIRQFVGHTGNTFGVAITQDSSILLTTSSDTTVRMWDIASGEELNRFEQHTDWIQEVVFSPDETFAISAGQDNSLRQWQIARTAEELVAWARGNRYIRELECAERQSYRLECES